MKVLSGDIGGTNTRLIVAEIVNGQCVIVKEKKYLSLQYKTLELVIRKFLLESNIREKIQAACLAVAGPVEYGVAKITNLEN